MSVEHDSLLERRIASALAERAASVPSPSELSLATAIPPRLRSRISRGVALSLVTLLILGAAAAFAAMRYSSDGASSTQARGPATTTGTEADRPLGSIGSELPLSIADTADTR